MRHTRILGIALVTFLAFAGGALALGVTLNASHSTDVNGHAVSGQHAVSASEKGVDVVTGLHTDVATVDGAASATLPALPPAPSLPPVPTLPHVSGDASASGSGSANVPDVGAAAAGSGDAGVKLG